MGLGRQSPLFLHLSCMVQPYLLKKQRRKSLFALYLMIPMATLLEEVFPPHLSLMPELCAVEGPVSGAYDMEHQLCGHIRA